MNTPRPDLSTTGAHPEADGDDGIAMLAARVEDCLRAHEASRGAALVVALSGGGDSVALLHAVLALGQQTGARVRALTVDHGRTPGSAARADDVRAQAMAAGAAAQVITLSPPPGPGQQAMRRARHAALAGAVRGLGAPAVLLMAHTLDDQIETLLMHRPTLLMAARAACPVWPEGQGVVVVRPLLGVSRAALRAVLRGAGAGWIEDAANDDPRFTRTRARQTATGLEAGQRAALEARVARLMAHRVTLEADSLALAGVMTREAAPVRWTLPWDAMMDTPEATRRYFLARAATAMGAVPAIARSGDVGAAWQHLAAGGGARTLAGCRLARREGRTGDRLELTRAPRPRGGAPAPCAGAEDSRFHRLAGLFGA